MKHASSADEQEVPSGVRAAEFYSGIGGLHLALLRSSVLGSVVRAYDWDQAACLVYNANHGTNVVRKCDIAQISAQELAELNASLWLLSPSCQPYTVLNPMAKGAADPRAMSFIHLIEHVLPQLVEMCKEPTHMLVENVAGFESSSTRERVLHVLKQRGYVTAEFLLTPLQFGIPNSRLRYYLLAKKTPLHFPDVPESGVRRYIPGLGASWVDPRHNEDCGDPSSISEVRRYLDTDQPTVEYRVPIRILEKWGRLFDIILPSARRSCCFTRGYTKLVERAGSIIQMNESLDTTAVFDQFLAAQKAGDAEAVRILDSLELRYFSPSELLRLFCFTRTMPPTGVDLPFMWPPQLSKKSRYKLIGNSVNIAVVSSLIDYLFR